MQVKEVIKEHDKITVNFRDNKKFAQLVSYHLGGCLFTGELILKDLNTGNSKTICSTHAPLYLEGQESKYIENLYEKHMAI
jgi:hypothetical protein